jgi:uncharacterized protein (DUF1015 family)
MARVTAFEAWVPEVNLAAEIASVPYDVIDSEEARAMAADNPRSFLHVIRPEIDLPIGTDLYSDAVYEKALENLEQHLRKGGFTEEKDALFVYRLIWKGRTQTGVVTACSVDEYDSGKIAIHERTRQDKEDDRTRHVVTMRCQAEPVFLAYRQNPRLDLLVSAVSERPPSIDFVAADGVQHTLWRVDEPSQFIEAFESIQRLFVADGHHRTKAASRARATLRDNNPDHTGSEAYNWVLAVVFPDNQLQILPYNRVIKDLRGETPKDALVRLAECFELTPTEEPAPTEPHTACVFANGRWYGFALPSSGDDILSQLDVSRLQDHVLAPFFGIDDPRTDKKIEFVGGIRGTKELETRAQRHDGLAFSLYPTSMEELFGVAEAGSIMPPKSTWFEPKLRSGLFLRRI